MHLPNQHPHQQESFGFHVWNGPLQPQHQAHAHTEIEWNFLLSGAARYFIAGRFQPLSVGRLALFWAAMPHRLIDAQPGSRMIWVTLPIAWLMQWNLGQRLIEPMLEGQLLTEPNTASDPCDHALLHRWTLDCSSASVHRRQAAILEAHARLHRFADALSADRSKQSLDHAGGDHIQRLTAFASTHFLDDIQVATIAQAAGLHPNYAMGLFKDGCGMSLWDYVTRLRIGHAQRLLLTTNHKITMVALHSGFNSPSRFYQAFQNIVGCTPTAYRQSVGQAGRSR
ncbi:MAG: helix-turn-helix domain-containing protein [Phycisphaerae bacterium]|nr:helix-turn-helix domain-containing protein [Phycisphaerae bacterium]